MKKRRSEPSRTGRLVVGRNALREVFKAAPSRILEVYTVKRDSAAARDLIGELQRAGLAIHYTTDEKLQELSGTSAHQSFVAVIRPKAAVELKGLLEASKERQDSLLLLLDSIQDPQNLGSILRAAECFGVDAVIWSKNRSPGITPAVSKASAGAAELVECIAVSNLADTLKKLKQHDYWVVAAENSAQAVDVSSFEFPAKCVLVLGSEGEGLHRLVKELADFSVKIPLSGKIGSLNVGQAAAVLLSCASAAKLRGSGRLAE